MARCKIEGETENKFNSHAALYKLKNGSPRLRDMIRKRCLERSKEGRENVLNRRRLLHEYEEVPYLAKNNETVSLPTDNSEDVNMYTLETPLLNDEEELILKQCETYLTDEEIFACIASESMGYQFICPICMKNYMVEFEQGHMIYCSKCGTTLDCSKTLQEFGELLSSRAISHNDKCSSCLSFFVSLEDNRQRLGILCTSCNFYSVI